MIVNFSDNLSAEITRMDKYYDASMNQINATFNLSDGSIDDFIEIVKTTGNNFEFTVGKELMKDYQLVNASESYDAMLEIKTITLTFTKSC